MAARAELPSLAGKSLRSLGLTTTTMLRLFNAGLADLDAHGTPYPYLAEALPQLNTDSWQVLPDGRMVTTYRLKPNLTWHDGQPLTADDFVFAYEVYSNKDFGLSNLAPLDQMEGIDAPDPRTVVVRWKQPYFAAGQLGWGGTNNSTSTIPSLPPLPRRLLEASYQQTLGNPEAFVGLPFWTTEYVGAGPYRLDRWEAGSFIEGVPFDNYVLGRPKIPRIRIAIIPDPNTVVANMLAGEAHIAVDDSVRFEQGAVLKQQWEARGTPGNLLAYPELWRWTQVQQRPELATPRSLTDPRVRQALTHAVDRQALNDVLFGGQGVMTETPVQPTVDYYAQVDAAITKYPYDLRRSEALMREAGYTKGSDGVLVSASGERFATELNVLASAQNQNEMSIMASGLRQAGFDMKEVVWSTAQGADPEVRNTFPGLSTTSGTGGEADLVPYRTANIPRAENRWQGLNRGGWVAPPEYDQVASSFFATLDRGERNQHIVQMARAYTQNAVVIGLYFNLGVIPSVAGLTGVQRPAPDVSPSWNVQDWEFH
ncbi:MAG: peptide/nickel transport system substrate-binding protein [Chloroflexota bacterium]|nr:peptide/nickel transport system substrate-binding protein [Chloroflexota bacterium]